MDLEEIRGFCTALPAVTEDVKWGFDLCFSVGAKMFCVCALEGSFSASFKVKDEEFDELVNRNKIIPAPYMARAKWIQVQDENAFTETEWKHFLEQSYMLVRSKLTKKIQRELGFE